ncbi:MAG: glycosyl transferase family 2 [Labilithrix sp.]|nr:glycosyl transferase family 2 [Labilithrix sp.]
MLTAVMHTRNRPDFVERAIRYYAPWFRHRLVVMDASTEASFELLKKNLAGIEVGFALDIVHHETNTPFYERLADTVEKVTTPYLMFMADDDFYFESWPDLAIAHLDRDPACGVVYGQTLHFEVDGYVPWGEAKNFSFSVPNPVARWMEHDTPVERLRELGKGPWTTIGWYAVQRKEIFTKFVSTALAAGFDVDSGERFLNVVQPVLGKLAMVEPIYLARQTNPAFFREPSPLDRPALAKLEDVTARILAEVASLDLAKARDVVRETMRAEIAQLEYNDRRKKLRIDEIKRKIPFAQEAVSAIKSFVNDKRGADPLAADPRFPAIPSLDAAAREIQIVKAGCVRRPV